MTTDMKRNVFKFRTHMLDFKENFKENYKKNAETKLCYLCAEHEDSQDALEKCKFLGRRIENLQQLQNLYTQEVLIKDAQILKEILKIRNT